MTDPKPSAKSTPRPSSRVARDTIFPIRLTKSEKEKLDSATSKGGFDSTADYIRDRLFRQPSDEAMRGYQRVEGDQFTDKQKGELAVAVLHQYRIHERAFAQKGGKDDFDEERRRAIADLGLQQLLGSGA